MTSKDFVLEFLNKFGNEIAKHIQKEAPNMSGTELYESETFIPDFNPEKQYMNFPIGYVCKSAAGRLVKLLQPYDSKVFVAQPEELPAQWGFYWSKDSTKALPFVAISTSPYMKDDCCTYEESTYRSLIDNNVWSPKDSPTAWERVQA